jgi:hypothetical protein
MDGVLAHSVGEEKASEGMKCSEKLRLDGSILQVQVEIDKAACRTEGSRLMQGKDGMQDESQKDRTDTSCCAVHLLPPNPRSKSLHSSEKRPRSSYVQLQHLYTNLLSSCSCWIHHGRHLSRVSLFAVRSSSLAGGY